VWHHDYLFWCGDFNYRIDLTKDEVIDLVQHENFEGLQMYDQLNVQRQNGSVIITPLKRFHFTAISILMVIFAGAPTLATFHIFFLPPLVMQENFCR